MSRSSQQVVVTTSSSGGNLNFVSKPSSPRLSPVHGSPAARTFATCGTSPDQSLMGSVGPVVFERIGPPSPDAGGRSVSPLGTSSAGTSALEPGPLIPSNGSQGDQSAPAEAQGGTGGGATLGVSRHRRRSRPSVSPERPLNSGSPSGGGSGRLPRLRRQSTTLDEGLLSFLSRFSGVPRG